MMERVLTSELKQKIGENVRLSGWFNNLRAQGKVNFLILRDRKGFAQIVIEDQFELKKIAPLHPGSILSIEGKAIANPQASLGVEVIQPKISVEVPIQKSAPIEYYKPDIPSDLDFILDHRPIALRNRKLQAIFKIQAELAHAYRLFMHDEVKAVEYFAPNIIGASSEGGG